MAEPGSRPWHGLELRHLAALPYRIISDPRAPLNDEIIAMVSIEE